jgi:outer membrane cobalamin receptor
MRTLTTTIALCLALLSSAAGEAAAQVPPPDTLDAVGQPHADSVRAPIIPIPLVGSVDRNLDSTRVIRAEELAFQEYRSLADILGTLPGAFVRDFGSPGLATGLTLRGAGAQSIALLGDGAPLNEPLTGAYNLAYYPTEQIERIEVVPATRSFLYGINGSGGLVNVVSKSKKALVAQSRIRYSESAHGYGFVDGTVSQDVIRGLNVTAGLQHATFDKRYANSLYDDWTAHAKIRYNVSSGVNAFASFISNAAQRGLNGGVDPATPDSLRYDELLAKVVNTDAYEKVTRYDSQLGVAVRPAFDSTSVHTLTFYLSTQLREYRDEENRPNPNGITVKEDHRSQWYGVRWLLQHPIGASSLDVGAEIASRAVIASPETGQRRETDKSAFGLFTLRPAGGAAVAGYARLEHYLSDAKLSYGGDATFSPDGGVTVRGGYSRSFRYPTFQESSRYENVVGSSDYGTPERHDVFEGSVRYDRPGGARLGLTLFRRVVRGAIAAESAGGREVVNGISLDGRARIGSFLLEGTLDRFDGGSLLAAGVPPWQLRCGAYFMDTVVNGHLGLKAGFRGGVTDGFRANAFDPRRLLYTGGADVGPAGTLDFLLIGHIGDAYIHLLWENLLGRQYVTTYLYPMEGRALRFGISWDFLN